jgi:hypothetical protein
LDSDFLINNTALDLTNKQSSNTTLTKQEPLDLDPIVLTTTATPTVVSRTFTVTKQQPTIILASSTQGQTTLSERSVLPKITVKTEPADNYDLEDHTGACFLKLTGSCTQQLTLSSIDTPLLRGQTI